jgi:hypothetical protein
MTEVRHAHGEVGGSRAAGYTYSVIKIFLPWYGEDLHPFVEYLLGHASTQVAPLCFTAIDNGSTQEGLFDGTTNHLFG